jgi:hypothetical protein
MENIVSAVTRNQGQAQHQQAQTDGHHTWQETAGSNLQSGRELVVADPSSDTARTPQTLVNDQPSGRQERLEREKQKWERREQEKREQERSDQEKRELRRIEERLERKELQERLAQSLQAQETLEQNRQRQEEQEKREPILQSTGF